MPTFPVKLRHPDHANPNKVITARNEEELVNLMRLGWKPKDGSNGVTIEGKAEVISSRDPLDLEAGK